MKNTNTRSRATAFLSLRVLVVLTVLLVFAGFGAASAWNGGISWLSMRTASAESKAPTTTMAVSAPLVIGTCDTAGPIEVESIGGTAAGVPTAYATLKLAFDAINLGVAHTGSIAIDVCGNTTETATAALNSGTVLPASYSDVTIRPVGAARIITGSIVGAIIKLNGADNVTIDGRIGGVGTNRDLSVTNTNTTTATAAVWLASVVAGNGASLNVIRNLEIACGADQQTSTVSTFGIIQTGTTISTTSTDGNDNDNNSFIANRIVRVRYGITSRGVTTNNNINPIITDNIIGPAAFGIDQIGKAGIYMQADTGATISRNLIQNVGVLVANAAGGADRIGIGIGGENWSVTDSTTITSGDYTVTRNVIQNIIEEKTFSAIGIKLGTTRSGVATNNLVANNFIINTRANGTSGDQFVGIGISGGNGDRVVFNSIAITGDVDPAGATASSTWGGAIRIPGANAANNANFLIQNNSIYLDVNSNTAAQHYFAITLNSVAYVFGTGGLNRNNYYINAANPQLRTGGLGAATTTGPGTEFATLLLWQGALTTPQDGASIQADPLYVSNTSDLHIPASSPNFDTGVVVGGIVDDIDGQVRPNPATSIPDIGADEFYALPGTLQLSSSTYGGNEGTTLVATVNRVLGSTGVVGVTYTLADGTGAVGGLACGPGIDYENPGPQMLSFGDSVTSQPINVVLCTDAVTDPAETFTITLSAPTGGATLGSPTVATATITDVPPPFSGMYSVPGSYPSLTNTGGIFEAINLAGATGPVTIEITADLTGETGTVPLNPIAGSPTVLIKPSGMPRTISGIAPIAVIRINGADNVRVDGSTAASFAEVVGGTPALRELTVRNDSTSAGTAVIALNSNTDGAQNNTIQNVNVDGNSPTTTLVVIHMGGAAIGTAGTDNDGNDVINCRIRRGFFGIYSAGAIPPNQNIGTRIEQNDVSSTGADRIRRGGILVFNDNGLQIIENSVGGIDNTGEGADAFGIGVGTQVADVATAASGGIVNANVTRNRVNGVSQDATFSAFGIGIAGGNTPAGLNNTVTNNMVTGVIADSNAGDIVTGIFVVGTPGSDTRLYHNSVSMTGDRSALLTPGTAQYPSYGIAITGADPVVALRNNIFYTTQTAALGANPAAFSYGIGMQTTTFANLDSDFNAYWSTGANDMGFRSGSLAVSAGTNYATVGLWSTAISDDVNSAILGEADPVYISPLNDLHLDGLTTPLLGDGITGFATIDFDSDPRPAAAPDIGADEIVQAEGGVIAGGTYYNALAIAGNMLGGPVTITNRMYLTGGVLNGNGNTLTIDCNGTVIGASDTNYVDGNVQKNFCATGSFSFPVGDPATGSLAPPPLNGYMPVDVTVTALGVTPSSLTVGANNGLAPSTPPLNPLTTLSAFWTLTEGGDLTANLAFNYQQGDVNGNEAVYRVIVVEGTTPYNFPTTVLDTVNNIASVPGITNFSDWTVGEPFAPTAIPANINGRVVTNTGAPLAGVTMTLLDTILVESRTTVTDPNGFYHFNAILTGRDILVTPSRNGFTFNPPNRLFNHIGELNNVDFAGTPDSGQVETVGNDYDGDGMADLTVFRPSEATWYTLLSATGTLKVQQWGLGDDRIVPADYDGDHVTDVAVFRPSNGTWYINLSSTQTLRSVNWGLAEDIVTPADFDGDGQADIAVWRPSTGTWYIIQSQNGQIRTVKWGINGDRPVAGDYDGDRKADIAVWRPSNGVWYVMKIDGSYTSEHWGIEEDRVVVGDYDGDHKSDLAVFRPSTATWYVKHSSDGSTNARGHGTAADVLTPADYDGDGMTDRAVWQLGGNWNILRSTTNTPFGQTWGTTGDIPTTSAYVR